MAIEKIRRIESLLRAKGVKWQEQPFTHESWIVRTALGEYELEWGYIGFDEEQNPEDRKLTAGPFLSFMILSPEGGTICFNFSTLDGELQDQSHGWYLDSDFRPPESCSIADQALRTFCLEEVVTNLQARGAYLDSEEEAFEYLALVIDFYLEPAAFLSPVEGD